MYLAVRSTISAIVAVDDDGDGVTDSYTYQGNSNHRQTTVSNGVEVDTNVAVS